MRRISKNTITILVVFQLIIFLINMMVILYTIEHPIDGEAIGIVKLFVEEEPVPPVLPKPPICIPKWECSEWGECMPEGKQYRTCSLANNCHLTYNKPAEEKRCPTCEDEIQNQGELDIDCGGPCSPCVPIIVERPETIMSPIAEFLFLAGARSLTVLLIALTTIITLIIIIILKRKKMKKWLKKKSLN